MSLLDELMKTFDVFELIDRDETFLKTAEVDIAPEIWQSQREVKLQREQKNV